MVDDRPHARATGALATVKIHVTRRRSGDRVDTEQCPGRLPSADHQPYGRTIMHNRIDIMFQTA